MDYRNGYKWYQLDPTKWFIWLCAKAGLASHLKVSLPARFIMGGLTRIQRFPENEIHKGMLTMELKHLRKTQEGLVWPQGGLPVVDWTTCTCSLNHFLLCVHFPCASIDQSQAGSRPLLCIAGFIHDLEGFMGDHPGGEPLLRKHIGKDATAAFFGGVYNHSNAAHNVSFYLPFVTYADLLVSQLLAMRRVGILHGGVPHITEEKYIPPSQLLRVAHVNELSKQGVY